MEDATERQAVAFDGPRRIAAGKIGDVALKVKSAIERGANESILVFDADTGERIEVDVRGSDADVLRRLVHPAPRSPGRPKLGVVAREVTLLPRHWDWLNEQPGGASVTLRKLVDAARHSTVESDRVRRAREATYRFMVVMAGDRPGFEDACRALFAGDHARFTKLVDRWPADIKAQAKHLLLNSNNG